MIILVALFYFFAAVYSLCFVAWVGVHVSIFFFGMPGDKWRRKREELERLNNRIIDVKL